MAVIGWKKVRRHKMTMVFRLLAGQDASDREAVCHRPVPEAMVEFQPKAARWGRLHGSPSR
jgi:hypothetical protein